MVSSQRRSSGWFPKRAWENGPGSPNQRGWDQSCHITCPRALRDDLNLGRVSGRNTRTAGGPPSCLTMSSSDEEGSPWMARLSSTSPCGLARATNRSRRRVPGGNHCGALAHRWAARALVAPALRDRISDAGPNRRRNVPGPRQVAPGPAAVPPRTNARGTCSMRRGHGGWYGIGTESPCARGKKGENGDSVPRHPRRNRFCLAEFWRLRRVWPWSWDYVKRRKQIIS